MNYKSLSVRDIAELYNVELVSVEHLENYLILSKIEELFPENYIKIGNEPTYKVCIIFDDKNQSYKIFYNKKSQWINDEICESILHELCHIVTGIPVNDEGPLMVLQWAIMSLLNEEEFEICRKIFSRYIFMWKNSENKTFVEITNSDEFLISNQWKKEIKKSIKLGYIDKECNPIFGAWSIDSHRTMQENIDIY